MMRLLANCKYHQLNRSLKQDMYRYAIFLFLKVYIRNYDHGATDYVLYFQALREVM